MHVVLEADSVGQEVALPPPRDRRPTTRQPYLAELSSPGRERACTQSHPMVQRSTRPEGGPKLYTEALVMFRLLSQFVFMLKDRHDTNSEPILSHMLLCTAISWKISHECFAIPLRL